jgi:hypothetical protein
MRRLRPSRQFKIHIVNLGGNGVRIDIEHVQIAGYSISLARWGPQILSVYFERLFRDYENGKPICPINLFNIAIVILLKGSITSRDRGLIERQIR